MVSSRPHCARSVVATLLVAAACSGGGGDSSKSPTAPPALVLTTLTVSLSASTVLMGQATSASATGVDQNGSAIAVGTVAWSSSLPTVATIAASGEITAVAAGQTTISGTSGGKSGQATLTIVPPLVFSRLVAGFNNNCALTTAGVAYCWGWNGSGDLGDGSRRSSSTPVAVVGDLRFTALAGGADFCGLASGGAVYCWGEGSVGLSRIPHQVGATLGLNYTALSLSYAAHACVLSTAGAAYCWGYNEFGQLGSAPTTPNVPAPIAVQGGYSFAAIAVGALHSCGLTSAGVAICWGDNRYGQLGDGTTNNGLARVAGGLTFSALSVGYWQTCALSTTATWYCWGIGPLNASHTPVAITNTGGLRFASLSVNIFHACGVTSGGSAYCWGDNSSGQLGNGTLTSSSAPVAVSGGLTFASVSAGYEYHSCGITTGGAVWCWGRNEEGELGDGTTTNRMVPVKVAGQP